MSPEEAAKAVDEALAGRTDLDQYGHNKRLLFAVQLLLDVTDIHSLAADALTDGSDDKACDLVHVDREAGLVLLAQGTEYGSARAAARDSKAAALHQAVIWTFAHEIDELSERLRPAVQAVRSALADGLIREIRIWFVHNRPESANVRRELDAIRTSASTAIAAGYPGLDLDIRVEEIGKDVLGSWYTDSPIPIAVSDEISIPVSSFLNDHGPGWEAYTVSVPAVWLQGLYWEHGEKLFSANIRGFLGSRNSRYDINNGIRLTLENEPENFWSYNNGITAIVHDVRYDDGPPQYGELNISGLSIVNGAQTVGALNKFTDQDALSKASIAMRVVRCSDPAIVRKIIRYNNRQNVIEPEDFRSTDRVQRRLVMEFNQLGITSYTGGRRGVGVGRVTSDAVDVETASRALASCHRMPGIAYNQKRLIWEVDRFYNRLFSTATTARHVLFCWSLLRAVEEYKLWVQGLSEENLPLGKKEQRAYFERRGSIHLMVTAIADCVDAILDRRTLTPSCCDFPGIHLRENAS